MMKTKFRVKVVAIHNDEDKGTSKFVPVGLYDVQADDFNQAVELGIEAARKNDTYADETAGDTELRAMAVTDLTKAKDL